MINPISIYEDAGRKAGKARRHHDEGAASFHHDWMTRAVRLERREDQPAAREAYDRGYREEARP